jgi:hypothetical protein
MDMNAATGVRIDSSISQSRNILIRVLTGTFSRCNSPILLIAALGMVLISTSAIAQTQSGLSSIQGTVADSTGAVIRGATVHIVNNATQVATDAKSNDVGFFQAPGLIAGTYTISISSPNMKTNV